MQTMNFCLKQVYYLQYLSPENTIDIFDWLVGDL